MGAKVITLKTVGAASPTATVLTSVLRWNKFLMKKRLIYIQYGFPSISTYKIDLHKQFIEM